jgi:hypothetical protein
MTRDNEIIAHPVEKFPILFCGLYSKLQEENRFIGIYEYGHASDAFLEGLALELRKHGWSDEQIVGAFVSRTMRKWLDSECGPREEIEQIGRKYAQSLANFGEFDHNHLECGQEVLKAMRWKGRDNE